MRGLLPGPPARFYPVPPTLGFYFFCFVPNLTSDILSVILSVMPTITIYVPAMKLTVIDAYCQGKKVSRGKLLTNCALSFINSQPNHQVVCDHCKRKPSVGKYRLVVYSWESGEQKREMQLCQYCLTGAKKEGEVTEI